MEESRSRKVRASAVATGALIFLYLGTTIPALGHARLVGTDPADGSFLDQPPQSITLDFNEVVHPVVEGIQLFGPDGRTIGGAIRTEGTSVVFEPESAVPSGTSTLQWRVISEDGHVITGTVVFHVREVTGPIEVPETANSTLGAVAANAIMYIGLLLGGGIALFSLHTHDGGPEWHALRRLARALLACGLVGVILLLVAKSIAAAGRFDMTTIPSGSALALSSATAGVALAASGLGRRQRGLTTAGVGLALISLVFIGHTRSAGPGWLVIGADLVHVSAGTVWVGGLVSLAIVCRQRRSSPPVSMILRFSSQAGWCLFAVLASGMVLAWRMLEDWSTVVGTNHGRLVLVKLVIVLGVGVVAAVNRYRIVPRITASGASIGRLGTSTAIEAVALSVVVLIAAALVEQDPHAFQSPGPGVIEGSVQTAFGPHTMTLTVEPGTVGANQVVVVVRDANASVVDLLSPPRITVTASDGESTRYDTQAANGGYMASIALSGPGRWHLDASARTDTFTESTASFRLDTNNGTLRPVSGLGVANARMPSPLSGAVNTVIYMTVSSGQSAELVSASSPVCEQVTFHETVLGSDGTSRMLPRPSIRLEPEQPVVFTSGSLHLMCEGPARTVSPGDLVPLLVTTADGEGLGVAVSVVTYAEIGE